MNEKNNESAEHFPAESEQARCCYRFLDGTRCVESRDTHSYCMPHAKQLREAHLANGE